MKNINKKIFLSSVIMLVFATLFFGHFLWISSKDLTAYKALLHKKNKIAFKNSLKAHNAQQKRKNVQKDIYIAKQNHRQHIRIFSTTSDLILLEKNGSVEYVEKFNEVQCWAQEHVTNDPPTQQLRYFTAATGKYSFQSHHFTAQDAHILFAHLAQTTIPETISTQEAFLAGKAEKIDYFFLEKKPHFRAQKCVFEINPKAMP